MYELDVVLKRRHRLEFIEFKRPPELLQEEFARDDAILARHWLLRTSEDEQAEEQAEEQVRREEMTSCLFLHGLFSCLFTDSTFCSGRRRR
jgi:hypothetical protein